MKRRLFGLALILLALALAGCGGKAKEESSSTSSAPAPTSGGGGTIPADLDQGPRANATPVDEAMAAKGATLFSTKGCTACHAMGKKLTGPDLQGVTARRTARWIESQILHPDLMTKQDPIARQLFAQFALQMPKQGLTPDEAKSVIEFFKQKDHEAGESHEKKEEGK